MRKMWVGLGLVGLMVASSVAGAWAAGGGRRQIEVEYQGIQLAVDGTVVDVGDLEPFIYLEKSRTFVPARPLAEALGAKVSWTAETNTVEIYSQNYVVESNEGEYTRWTLPAGGVSLKAPRGYMRASAGLGALELMQVDFATGQFSLVVARKQAVDGDTPATRAQNLLQGLGMLLLPEAKVDGLTEEPGAATLTGSTLLQGKLPARFRLKVVDAGAEAWVLLALTQSAEQEQAAAQILASFANQ